LLLANIAACHKAVQSNAWIWMETQNNTRLHQLCEKIMHVTLDPATIEQ